MSDPAENIPQVLRDYLLMWNEKNPEAIRGHLDVAVAEDCLWIDPLHQHTGRDALEANVRGFRDEFANAELGLASNVDGHNLRYRYEWVIKDKGAVLLNGFDVATLNNAGLIERVDGFFERLIRIDSLTN